MELWTILSDIVLLLAACLIIGGIFSRFGQSPLVGYLFAGMFLGGPGSIGAVHSEHEIEAIAELGVALLLFSLGLEFSLARLKKLGAKPLLGGVFQVVLTSLVGAAAALPFASSTNESIAFGLMIALSSTAVVLRILMERAELEMPHGRNSLAVLLVQDMAVVPLALVMTLLGGGSGSESVAEQVGRIALLTSGLVVGLYLLNFIALRALGTLTLLRNRELTMIFAIVTGLGSAWAAHAAGVSPALGAFVAGMFLGSSAFATQVRSDIASLRIVLLTLFFGAAGMIADPIWIVQNFHIVLAVTVAITIGKMAIIWAIFQSFGHTIRVASATGVCLAQIGEFAFVLGSIGRANDAVSADMYALVVSVTIVSFIVSALLVPRAPSFGNRIAAIFGQRPPKEEESSSGKTPADVVFIGFGPAGRIAAQPLVDCGAKVLVIDLNQDGIRAAKDIGFEGQIGDATQSEVLEHAHLRQAKVVVITVPHYESAMTMLELIRRLAPHVRLLVRSRYHMHTDDFISAGAHHVVGDEEQVGESLSQEISKWVNDQRVA